MFKVVNSNYAKGEIQHMGVLDLFLFLFNSEVSVLTFVVHKKDLIYLLVCRLSVVFFKIATAFFIRYEAASVFVA